MMRIVTRLIVKNHGHRAPTKTGFCVAGLTGRPAVLSRKVAVIVHFFTFLRLIEVLATHEAEGG